MSLWPAPPSKYACRENYKKAFESRLEFAKVVCLNALKGMGKTSFLSEFARSQSLRKVFWLSTIENGSYQASGKEQDLLQDLLTGDISSFIQTLESEKALLIMDDYTQLSPCLVDELVNRACLCLHNSKIIITNYVPGLVSDSQSTELFFEFLPALENESLEKLLQQYFQMLGIQQEDDNLMKLFIQKSLGIPMMVQELFAEILTTNCPIQELLLSDLEEMRIRFAENSIKKVLNTEEFLFLVRLSIFDSMPYKAMELLVDSTLKDMVQKLKFYGYISVLNGELKLENHLSELVRLCCGQDEYINQCKHLGRQIIESELDINDMELLSLMVSAQNWQKAMQVAEAVSHKIYTMGKEILRFQELLDQFPNNFDGIGKVRQLQLDVVIFRRASDHDIVLEIENYISDPVLSVYYKCRVYEYSLNYDESIRLAEQVDVSKLPSNYQLELALSVSNCYLMNSQMTEALKWFEKARKLVLENPPDDGLLLKYYGYEYYYKIHSIQQHSLESMENLEPRFAKYKESKPWLSLLSYKAYYKLQVRNFEEAKRLALEVMGSDAYELFPSVFIYACQTLYEVGFYEQDYKAAEYYSKRALDCAKRANYTTMIAEMLSDFCVIYSRQGKYLEALEQIENAWQSVKDKNPPQTLILFLKIREAELLILRGDFERACELLLSVIGDEHLIRNDVKLHTCYSLALVYEALGDEEQHKYWETKYLSSIETLELAQRQHFEQSIATLQKEFERSRYNFKCIHWSKGRMSLNIPQLADMRVNRSQFDCFLDRIQEKFYLFGNELDIFKKPVQVSLLAELLNDPGAPVNAETMIKNVWGTVDSHKSKETLRISMYRLRKLINTVSPVDLIENLGNGCYRFNNSIRFFYIMRED